MSYVCGKVSGVGSAMVATYAFTGPLASRLVSRYGLHSEEGKLIDRDAFSRWGTRVVCIMGALLSTCGLVLGSFAKTLEHIMVAYRCSKKESDFLKTCSSASSLGWVSA